MNMLPSQEMPESCFQHKEMLMTKRRKLHKIIILHSELIKPEMEDSEVIPIKGPPT